MSLQTGSNLDMPSRPGGYVNGFLGVMLVCCLFLVSAPLRMSIQQTIALALAFSTMLLALHSLREIVYPARETVQKTNLILILVALFVLYSGMQVLPLPGALMSQVSPTRAGVWTTGAYGIAGMATISLDITSTIWFVLQFAGYLAVLYLAFRLAGRPGCFLLLTAGIFLLGLGQVLFDMVSRLYGFRYVSMADIDGHGYRLTGTFVNSNNLSALLNLSISAGLLLVWKQFLACREHGALILLPSLLMVLAGILMLVYGSIQAGSSGGFFSFLAAIVLIGLALAINRASAGLLAGLFALVVAMVLFLWLYGSRELNLHQIVQYSSLESRLQIWKDVLEMWKSFPLLGVGGGAFEWTFPAFKSDQATPVQVASAHSSYFHLLAETGVAGMLILLCVAGLTGSLFLDAIRTGTAGTVSAGLCMVGVFSFLIHEIVETSLFIPSVALPFFCLLGLALRACESTISYRSRNSGIS